MDKSVERYLIEHDQKVEKASSTTMADDDMRYDDWFKQKILGLDSEEYRRAFWREAYTTGHTIGHLPRTLDWLLRERLGAVGGSQCGTILALMTFEVGVFPFWLLARLLTREIARVRRKTYYERERERRYRLVDERRAIRVRRTVGRCPSLDEVRGAWERVRALAVRGPHRTTTDKAHAMAVLRLGALLEDLECFVDNHAYVKRGVPGARGRAPGIKGLFAREAPDLFAAYKAVMRCKAIAKKFRQACDCVDPVPVDALLSVDETGTRATTTETVPTALDQKSRDFTAERSEVKSHETQMVGGVRFPVFPCLANVEVLRNWMAGNGNTAYLRTQKWVIRPDGIYTERNLLRRESLELAAETLSFGGGTLVALEAAIALRIDPDCMTRESRPDTRVRVRFDGRRLLRTPERIVAWIRRHVGVGPDSVPLSAEA